MTGRTLYDWLREIPIWMIGLAALMFVILVAYSLFGLRQPHTLGFMGEFGPKEREQVSGLLPTGVILAWDPIVRDATGTKIGLRDVPEGWRPCGEQPTTPSLDGKFLMGVSTTTRAGEEGGQKDFDSGTHQHTGNAQAVGKSFDTVCNGKCAALGGHSHTLNIDEGGAHTHGDNRPPYYSVVLLCEKVKPDATSSKH
jgi:hypothetical protein